jgi:hypothetical protein
VAQDFGNGYTDFIKYYCSDGVDSISLSCAKCEVALDVVEVNYIDRSRTKNQLQQEIQRERIQTMLLKSGRTDIHGSCIF